MGEPSRFPGMEMPSFALTSVLTCVDNDAFCSQTLSV